MEKFHQDLTKWNAKTQANLRGTDILRLKSNLVISVDNNIFGSVKLTGLRNPC
jgi:hypothetical protein